MSEIRVDNILSADGTAAPVYSKGIKVAAGQTLTNEGDFVTSGKATFNSGAEIVGVTTFHSGFKNVNFTGITTFSGGATVTGVTTFNSALDNVNITGISTFNNNVKFQEGLNVTGVCTFQNIAVTAGVTTFTGNVSVGGTLTYEDVTNVDSVGVVTARSNLYVGSAITCYASTGIVSATAFHGDGSGLSGVISGVETKQSGTSKGTAQTELNFVGATVSSSGSESTVTVAATGISTGVHVKTNGQTATLDLDVAQDHKVTASGSVHITTINGLEGGSHSLRIVNNGTATIGFSTNFIWASGSPPAMPSSDGAISLISFTAHKVGVGTQLLAGAALNYN